MKKLLLILLLLPAISFAAPISKERANAIGENFFSKSIEAHRIAGKRAHFVAQQQPNMKKVRQNTGYTYTPYYIFNNEGGGFVIVAGDDCATPILGYSTEGSIDPNDLPIQLEELLNAYAEEIQQSVENNDQPIDSIQALWDAYNRAPQSQNATAVVNALIATSWDQAPRYNNKCPSDASLSSLGGHPSTGCVATAMGQIMKYWGYPKKGTGSESYKSEYYGTLSTNFAITEYDWTNMPLKLSSSTSSTQNNAVATLLYHCGVAVHMQYNCDGRGSSGAYVVDYGYGRASAEKALKTYFGYASTLQGKTWTSSVSTSSWKSMLKTELDNNRPILYAGHSQSSGGHAFVCDGYDSNDKFHFNWGWSGQANGFFSLTALTPSGYSFSENQQAVIGIKPKDGSSPAKTYDLYMNTDLTPVGTTSSSSETNPFTFGKTLSFTAKIENNGTGTFNGSFKVGLFTYDDREFIAWSKESYHFSLGAGKVTEKKTYTFDGGVPFIPGKYIAYMYYQDDDETDCKLVKTDEGTFWTEYNNVICNVVSFGDLKPVSPFEVKMGELVPLSAAFIEVLVKNTALLTTFYGDIRLSLYDSDGKFVQVLDSADYSSGIPALSTVYLDFYTGPLNIEPGSYYMALTYKKSNENTWYYMGCTSQYLNPVKVDIKAPVLKADDNEPNNTQSTATEQSWFNNGEDISFANWASLHENSDIDYYKLSFPESNHYKVTINLHDKYNKCDWIYVNADAQFAYSIGGDTYSSYSKDSQTITFDGPTTLYLRVNQFGLSGLGYYEFSGHVEETVVRNCKTLPYTESFASSQGEFTVDNKTMPSGFTSIWNWDSQYGMVAKCIKGSTKYDSESWLISPCIGIPSDGETTLTFSHAAKFFQNTSQMTLWVSTNYDPIDPLAGLFPATWEQLTIPTYPPGNNWTWYNSGDIDLSAYKGQYVNIAFRYTSNTSYAPQWEIKNFSVQNSLTPIDNISADQQPSTKILRNGQILIQKGDKIYTITGQEVK